MALGTNKLKDSNLVFVQPRDQDKDRNKIAPFFQISRVVGEKIELQENEKPTSVGGDLVKVELKTRVNNKTKESSDHVIVYLKDDGAKETYHIDFTYRIASRSMFNALIALDGNYSDISIDFYESKKGYATFATKQGGARLDWKYQELPAPKQVTFNKKTQNDYSEQDEFLKKELQALSTRLAAVKGG